MTLVRSEDIYMRPTSVIFLIISILIACLGVMLCLGAVSMANENGEELFAQVKQENGDYVITKYFGLAEGEEPDSSSNKNDTKKIELVFENVDVIIKGGSSVNKIEFVNFTEGMFSYKASVGGALTIEDLNGLMKMLSFGTSGINFKGFRNLLFYHEYNNLDRSVIVYISDDSNVNNISCTVKNGSISVENIDRQCDLTLTTSEGDVTVDKLSMSSSVTVNAEKGSVTVSDSSLYDLSVTAGEASVDVTGTEVIKSILINAKNGDVSYEHIGLTFDGFDVDMKALDGKLTINGSISLNPEYTYDGAPDEDPNKPSKDDDKDNKKDGDETTSYIDSVYVPNSIKIVCEKGNITVTNVEKAPEEPEEPEVPDNNNTEVAE